MEWHKHFPICAFVDGSLVVYETLSKYQRNEYVSVRDYLAAR